MNRILTIIIFMHILQPVTAQRYSEEEIALTHSFIQANQKKVLNKYDEALEIYQKILEKEPLNATVHHDMARIYLAQEKFTDAKKSAEKAIRNDPENIWFLLTHAKINETVGDYKEAAESYHKVVALRPNDIKAYELWAQALKSAGRPVEAIDAYTAAQNTFGRREVWVDAKVEIYLSNNMNSEAEKEIKKFISKDPFDVDRLIKLGNFYMFTQKKKKAQKIYKRILAIDPNNEKAILNLGLLDTASNNKNRAGKLSRLIYDSRISMDHKIKSLIPYLDVKTDDSPIPLDDLLIYAKYMVKIYPEDAKVYALLADVYVQMDSIDMAIPNYINTLELDKTVYEIWDQLMASLLYVKKFEDLGYWSSTAIDYYPNQSAPYYYNAWAKFTESQYDQALSILDEAVLISLGNLSKERANVILRARILSKSDSIRRALDVLLSRLETDPSGEILELSGDLYLEVGDKDKALEYWRQALEAGGNTERINTKIHSS